MVWQLQCPIPLQAMLANHQFFRYRANCSPSKCLIWNYCNMELIPAELYCWQP